MHIKVVNKVLMLCIDPDIYITFRNSWIENLFKLQYTKYGEYIKSQIYPVLSDSDRKLWNKSTISNKELQQAIEEFKKGLGEKEFQS